MMEPEVFKQHWLAAKGTSESHLHIATLARQVAISFIRRYSQDGYYEPRYIDLLCEMATTSPESEGAQAACSALFEIVIEKLCDDFEQTPGWLYPRVMSQVVSFCRHRPEGAELDRRLEHFAIHGFEDLYQRSLSVQTRRSAYDPAVPPKRLILLSRVTIGADVAILSVLLQRALRLFPNADVVVIGSPKLQGIFGGHKQIRIRDLDYHRRGGLFERFSMWYALLDILAEEMSMDGEEGMLLIDPDSRITQLGVLPIAIRGNDLFFNTRTPSASSEGLCMAELANEWMDRVFGAGGFCHPAVWIPAPLLASAGQQIGTLRAAGCQQIITVNLGVGGNSQKQLGLDFERKLLSSLLSQERTVVILDKGVGSEELTRSSEILLYLSRCGHPVVDVGPDVVIPRPIHHGVVAVARSIGEMAGLIAQSDEYIGYDSACQHIAAATGTATLTIFTGTDNTHFVRRWRACGPGQCRVVHVNSVTPARPIDTDEVIHRVMQERRSTSGFPQAQDRARSGQGPVKK